MQLAIDNLNGAKLTDFSFDSQQTITEFVFENHLHLECKPYADAAADEEYWILFTKIRSETGTDGCGNFSTYCR
jgi:hypothetical protein